MTNEFIAYAPDLLVKDAIENFRKDAEEVETVYYLYVIDADEKIRGVISLRDLLLARPDVRLSDIMKTKLKIVSPETDEMAVAEIVAKYNLVAIPVVDSDGYMLGIVTIDDVVDRILPSPAKRTRRKV